MGEVLGSDSAGIFEAHLQVVDDPSFVDEVYREVRVKRRNVERILSDVAERYARTLLQMDDDYLRERATDIRDVTRRILGNLAGGGRDLLAGLETPRVLIARDLPPSEMVAFDRRRILGIVTELGSPTSHVAIMARAMDLPAIVGMSGVCGKLADGERVILDGVRGRLVVHPTAAREEEYSRIARNRAVIQKRLAKLKAEEAVTRTDMRWCCRPISRCPGRGCRPGTGARGIGLFRSEYLFMGRARARRGTAVPGLC